MHFGGCFSILLALNVFSFYADFFKKKPVMLSFF
jgi:hypothetical protein